MATQLQTKTSAAVQGSLPQANPYPVSFIDRLMQAVKRLPLPFWLTYLLLFIAQGVFITLLAWLDGWLPVFTFSPLTLIFPLWLWGPLAIMTHINSVSQQALSSFSPFLEVDQEKLEELRARFTTLPQRPVILSGLLWCAFYIPLTYTALLPTYVDFGIGPLLSLVYIFQGLVSFFIGSAIYYHSFHQLRLVNSTVKLARQFNIFRLDPVYAFSRVTSQIGISWMFMVSLTLMLFPIKMANGLVFTMLIMQVILAVAAFVLPLVFVNRRLTAEKRRLLTENNLRLETALAQLHRNLDERQLAEMERLNEALAGLKTEREVLNSIPTWPWRAGTLTGFVSALILPLALFVIQFIIEKWLSG